MITSRKTLASKWYAKGRTFEKDERERNFKEIPGQTLRWMTCRVKSWNGTQAN